MKFSIFATPFIIGLALISPAMGCSGAPSINVQIFDLLNRIFRPSFQFWIRASDWPTSVASIWKLIIASLHKSLFNLNNHEPQLPHERLLRPLDQPRPPDVPQLLDQRPLQPLLPLLPPQQLPLLQLPQQLVLHLLVKFKEINSLLSTQIMTTSQFACPVMVPTDQINTNPMESVSAMI